LETIRLDYLNTFLVVARTKSFSLAAKELKTSQGTVSHHIAAIEEYFGAKLFMRLSGGVELTEAGKTLRESAEQILKEAQQAKAKISNLKSKVSGTIRIAASTIPGEHVIPGLVSEFQTKCPEIKFKINAQDSLMSLNSLLANDVDFAAVGTIQKYEEKLDFLPIGKEALVLVVPCNHELAKHKKIKLAKILSFPFISREETSGTRVEIENLLKRNGFGPNQIEVSLELGSTESVITAVSEGRGISIISSIAATKAQAAGLVKVVSIEDAKTARRLYIAKRKGDMLNPSELFWGFCKTYKYVDKTISCAL
jgi:DNA-binding transcriptional LysR family regulator